ncbi:MAG TPA: DUF2723 domain-containing protein [Gemmatimonadaceae bacterium]|nr:DUF2723 domain-containing protein [Gemmatimonadaceae bacterium]
MSAVAPTDPDYRPSYAAAAIVGAAVLLLYLVTLAPTTAMWDTSEYIAAAYVLGNPHPPGNPLFVLLGRVFAVLPIAPTVAMRINVLAAIASAASAAFWFLVTERVLVHWFPARWQRIVGGALGALIGATAFTVWNQSVANEKVYTIALLGLAAVSWLTVRWCDEPDGVKADRTLVLIGYLLGLGFSNHPMGLLALPAVVVAVLVRRPAMIFRWKLIVAFAGAGLLGATVFAIQPIRAGFHPAINEGDPRTWHDFWYNLTRGQYGKPSVLDRQAPLSAQLGMYWQYFRWQWLRAATLAQPVWQNVLAGVYLALGLGGGYVHWRRDRSSFWYFGTFLFTLTIALVVYLNFKYGYSQAQEMGDYVLREVRERDYFYIVSFSAWGVWAALGLAAVWKSVGEMFGSEQRTVAGARVRVPHTHGWAIGSVVLLVGFVPLAANWKDASRAGQTTTRDFAYDLLQSVEPYGILVTVGDNDTFPLWYAQEVEGIRKDVLVANTSLLGTDWYVKQLLRRPIYEYDSARGPAIYRGKHWNRPSGPPLRMSAAQANALPPELPLSEPMTFEAHGVRATIRPDRLPGGALVRADLLVLQLINDSWPDRPVYFSRTTGDYPEQLGLEEHLLTQGIARKLVPPPLAPGRDTVLVGHQGLVDANRTLALWYDVYRGPQSVLRAGRWVDQPSVQIPFLYVTEAALVAQLEADRGHAQRSTQALDMARQLADAIGLSGIIQPAAASPALPLPVESGAQTLPFLDSTRHDSARRDSPAPR